MGPFPFKKYLSAYRVSPRKLLTRERHICFICEKANLYPLSISGKHFYYFYQQYYKRKIMCTGITLQDVRKNDIHLLLEWESSVWKKRIVLKFRIETCSQHSIIYTIWKLLEEFTFLYYLYVYNLIFYYIWDWFTRRFI